MTELPVWARDVLSPSWTAEDQIASVVSAMNIKELDVERRQFLADLSSFDISACPGSGKTTLVVAKILLLSRTWESRTRGMLMLSHTNVAKNEVAKRFESLGEKLPADGRPHYIGTIHAFINKFLTTPYLLSVGIEPRAIDDDIALNVRKQFLGQKLFGLSAFLLRKHTTLEAIRLTEADLDKPFGESLLGVASAGTESYRSAAHAVRESIKLGYLRHDEIFVFANRYLDLHPEIAAALRHRFPFIMIDEMQDTTTEQAKLLARIFPQDQVDISVERIGDPNQAIYGSDHQNGFPRADYLSIANSFRFDETIARLASPLAVHSVQPDGLRGVDRDSTPSTMQHAFIVFHADAIDMVLPTFAQFVADVTPAHIARTAKISAVGARHFLPKDEADNPNHFPKVLRHYLPTYAPRSAGATHASRTFTEYVIHARGLVEETSGLSAGLEHVAEGLLRFVNSGLSYRDRASIKPRKYRQLMDLLESVDADVSEFREGLGVILAPGTQPTFREMNDFGQQALALVTPLATALGSTPKASVFFDPSQIELQSTRPKAEKTRPANSYVHSTDGALDVLIEVSSIHAAKGETHGATLVLDTFNRTRFVEKLLPWLTGKKASATVKTSNGDKKRLHECYVAMTRPTHLLAVAAVEKSLGKSEAEIEKSIEALEAHGWKVLRLPGKTARAAEPAA
jgi:DNA helicase-2/ATP-dependent DNA helicase PcrA